MTVVTLLPKIANLAWLLIRYRDKRRAVLSNFLATVFYVVQAMLFLGFISCATFFFASAVTHDYDDFKDFEVQISYLWQGVYMTVTGALAALYCYSWTMLVFKYRKHLRAAHYDTNEL